MQNESIVSQWTIKPQYTHISFVMFERQTGVYIGSKIPQVLRKAIQHAVMSGSYLNSSDFLRDAIKEKLQREGYLLSEQSVREIGDSNE